MFIWTCVIGKVDLMLFRNYTADILFRIEVIDQPGSSSCAPSISENCLCEHCSFAPPGQGASWRQVTCLNFNFFSGLSTFPAKAPAKLFNLKTRREKYHDINFSKSLSQTLVRFQLQKAGDKEILLLCLPMWLSMENLTGSEALVLKRWCAAFCGYCSVETEQKTKDCACVYRGAFYHAPYEERVQVTLPLFSTLIRPPVDYCVQLWDPLHNKEVHLLDWIQPKGILQDS